MRVWKLPFLFIALMALPGTGRAAPQDAAGFIDGMVGQALDTLRDQSLTEAAREERFDALLQRGFDMPRIARYVLGRYWQQANEADRAAFAQLFERWLVRSYAARLSQYKGQTVKVMGARAEGNDGAVVTTEVVSPSGAPPIKLDWRVADSAGAYKILDVTVAGVSMALTERDEIAATIERDGGTVAALNRSLAQRLGDSTTASR